MKTKSMAVLVLLNSVAGLLQFPMPVTGDMQQVKVQRGLQTMGGGLRTPLRRFRRHSKDVVPVSPKAIEGSGSMESSKGLSLEKVSDVLTNLFPIWTIIFSLWGMARPSDFAWLTTEYFTAGLAVLMVSMGLTMTPKDFVRVASRPGSVFVNFALCYGFMPLLGLVLGKAFNLEPALVAGLVLVGSINGGQASNLCTYIARGNVALSVLMTTATTIGAIVMTPFLCQKYLGAVVPVDAIGIVKSTLQVVLGPIIFGMGANVAAPKVVNSLKPILPLVGVSSTCLLVASSVGQVAGPIKAAGLSLQVPVFLLHFLGGIFGYWIARFLGFGETTCRTMAIETSMKSSAFGFLLAKLHMGAEAARVPSAVSVVWMALTGSTLAVIWRFIPVPKGEEDKK